MSEAPALPAVSRPIEARPALSPAAGVGGPREVPSPSPPSDVAAPAALVGVPDPVRQAASRAAEALFGGREVEVDSFYDEDCGYNLETLVALLSNNSKLSALECAVVSQR